MKLKITTVIIILLIAIMLSGCEWGNKCHNCNASGTPYPTLAPDMMDWGSSWTPAP